MSTRLASRCALALIQIWASVANATSFAHCCVGILTTHAHLRTLLDQLRPRRAFWQAIYVFFLSCEKRKCCEAGLFIPLSQARGLQARNGVER